MSGIETAILSLEQNNAAVFFDETQCVYARNRKSSCRLCIDACPSEAISFADGVPSLDASACVGCGVCAALCPTQAFAGKAPTDAELLAAAREAACLNQGEAVIACAQMCEAAAGLFDVAKVVRVSCLASLRVDLLAPLAAGEEVEKVTLVHGSCESCALASCRAYIEEGCSTAGALLSVWNAPSAIKLSDKLPGKVRSRGDEGYDKDKRDFFTAVKDEAQMVAVAGAQQAISETLGESPSAAKPRKLGKGGVLPQSCSAGRARLLNALDSLGQPQPVALNTRLWGSVSIDMQECDSCRVCATYCPTGALFRFHTQDGKIGLKHRSRDCVACRCCQDMCPKKAITVSTRVVSTHIADGSTRRFLMNPKPSHKGEGNGMMYAMRELLGTDLISER